MSELDTPRTEHELVFLGDGHRSNMYVHAYFARQLERALTQSQARCAELEKAVLGECEECGRTIITPLHHLPSVEKDAARYRWLARALGSNGDAIGLCLDADSLNLSKEAFDASVDAALAEHTPK